MHKPDISMLPDTIFQVGPFDITNGHMAMFLVTILVLVLSIYVSRKASFHPNRLQIVFEFIITLFIDRITDSFGNKKYVGIVFPVAMTLFLVILISNQLPLLFPLYEALTYGEGTFLLRMPTSDLSMTLSLGIFVIVLSNVLALIKSPILHINKYINIIGFFKIRSFSGFLNACLEFALGFMEIVGEISKMFSISVRLFGNIFSGMAIFAVLVFLQPYLLPVPFIALDIFVGLIQAMLFSLLAIQYFSTNLASHH